GFDFIGADAVLPDQFKHAAYRPCIAVTAGPAFHVDAGLEHFPWLAECVDRRGEWRAVVAAIRCKEIVVAVENIFVCRKSVLRHPGGKHAAARRMARVKWLGHRAEIAHEPRYLRGRDSPRRLQLLHIESPQ